MSHKLPVPEWIEMAYFDTAAFTIEHDSPRGLREAQLRGFRAVHRKPSGAGAQSEGWVTSGLRGIPRPLTSDEMRSSTGGPPTEPRRSGMGPPRKCRRMHPISGRTHAVAGGVGAPVASAAQNRATTPVMLQDMRG
jgi:hypothetical protein